jgi:hypothetical protein
MHSKQPYYGLGKLRVKMNAALGEILSLLNHIDVSKRVHYYILTSVGMHQYHIHIDYENTHYLINTRLPSRF